MSGQNVENSALVMIALKLRLFGAPSNMLGQKENLNNSASFKTGG